MKHENKIKWMINWSHKNNVRLELEGECGFGRECVGIIRDSSYPDYEWHDKDYNRIDNNGDVWTPDNAYHKHSCVAVLGRGEKAESQLYNWLKWFDNHGFVVEYGEHTKEYISNLHPIELIMGKHKYVRMVKKEGSNE